jgi:hypothetical protein
MNDTQNVASYITQIPIHHKLDAFGAVSAVFGAEQDFLIENTIRKKWKNGISS